MESGSVAFFQQLADALPQLVWTARPDGFPDYFNQHWLDYTGQVRQDTPTWFRGSIHPDDVTETTARWQEAVQTGTPYEMEYRIRGADGEYRWFLGRGLPLRNEQTEIIKWFGTCTLIDQQKRTEQTQRFLAELSDQIRPLANPEEVLWTVVNALGRHLQVTHCTYAEVQLERNQFISYRDFHWQGESFRGVYPLDVFGEDLLAAMKAGETYVVNDAFTDSRTIPLYETLYQSSNIRAFITVPLIKEGRWTAALSVTMHAHPRVWTRDEVTLLEKIMEQTWLSVENARLLQAERERSEQLTLAISEIHHRVKNSLQSVAALLELQLPLEGDTIPVEAVIDSLSQIKTIALVHDLLARDKPIGTVDAARVLENISALLSSGWSSGGHQVRIVVDAESLEIPTKAATALALTVNELLTNAIKHQGRQVAPEKAEESTATICVSLRPGDDQVALVIQDSGPGFPPDFNPTIHAHIGLELVQTLVGHDLQGNVRFINAVHPVDSSIILGGRVEIEFPRKFFGN